MQKICKHVKLILLYKSNGGIGRFRRNPYDYPGQEVIVEGTPFRYLEKKWTGATRYCYCKEKRFRLELVLRLEDRE